MSAPSRSPVITSALRTGSTRLFRVARRLVQYSGPDLEIKNVSDSVQPGLPYKSHSLFPSSFVTFQQRNPHAVLIQSRRGFFDTLVSSILYHARTRVVEGAPIYQFSPDALNQTDPDLVRWVIRERSDVLSDICGGHANHYGRPAPFGLVIDYEAFDECPSRWILVIAQRLRITIATSALSDLIAFSSWASMVHENTSDSSNISRGAVRRGSVGGWRDYLDSESQQKALLCLSQFMDLEGLRI